MGRAALASPGLAVAGVCECARMRVILGRPWAGSERCFLVSCACVCHCLCVYARMCVMAGAFCPTILTVFGSPISGQRLGNNDAINTPPFLSLPLRPAWHGLAWSAS